MHTAHREWCLTRWYVNNNNNGVPTKLYTRSTFLCSILPFSIIPSTSSFLWVCLYSFFFGYSSFASTFGMQVSDIKAAHSMRWMGGWAIYAINMCIIKIRTIFLKQNFRYRSKPFFYIAHAVRGIYSLFEPEKKHVMNNNTSSSSSSFIVADDLAANDSHSPLIFLLLLSVFLLLY